MAATTTEQDELFRQLRALPGGLIDAGATVARSALMQPVAGYAGLLALMRGKGAGGAADAVRDIEENARRDPETKAGGEILKRVGQTIEPVADYLKTNVADPVGKVSPLLGAALVAVPEVLPGPKGKRALRTEPGSPQGLLPGVEPRTRGQLLEQAQQAETRAGERMSFDDPNRGLSFHHDPGADTWRMSETEGPVRFLSGMTREDTRWGDRPARANEGYLRPPEASEPAPEHVNFRRRVGEENAQRILEKRETFDAAQAAREAAEREHRIPAAKEEIAERTARIEQLRDELSRATGTEEPRRLEHEIYQTMRGKPIIGPNNVYRPDPQGRDWRFLDPETHFTLDSEIGPEATTRRAAIEGQRDRALLASRADMRADELYQQMRRSPRREERPEWVQQLERENPGRAAPSDFIPAPEDWWKNDPSVVAKLGELPKPPPPPPNPNDFKARTVNAFLRASSENPAMFEFGGNPKATNLRGIADEMSASRGGQKKTGGAPVRIDWRGTGDEPGPGQRGSLELEVPGVGRISGDLGRDGKMHIGATEGGDAGALLYQILNNHANKNGYKITGDHLFRVNELRVGSNILSEGARSGGKLVSPRDMRGTSHGDAPKPTGHSPIAKVWQAEQASTRSRVARAAPESLSAEPGVQGGDPRAVRFDPKAGGFSINGEQITGSPDRAINARINELSPGLIGKNREKPNSTGVGAKTLKRRAVWEWLQNATPKEAREVAKNWKDWGSLFSTVGITVGEVLKAANDAEEQGSI